MSELSRVPGCGIVPGVVVLVGGDPGIGKSTLLLQMAAEIANSAGPVLYVSAEESADQIRRRAACLGLSADRLFILSEIVAQQIAGQAEQMKPALLIVDSIQAIYTENGSSVRTTSQVRDCAALLLRTAKQSNIPLFLVGHVTKEGAIAGPKVLEHLVDVVLQLEGERFHAYRLLRSVKNRFGSTNEVGIFEMTEQGMAEVANPSELFLAERLPNAAGCPIAVSMEGTLTAAGGGAGARLPHGLQPTTTHDQRRRPQPSAAAGAGGARQARHRILSWTARTSGSTSWAGRINERCR